MTEHRVAVVAGGLGVIGHALAQHLTQRDGWDVVAISRRKPDGAGRARHLQLDLLDPLETIQGLAAVGATHLFFAAYQDRRDQVELADLHLAMLQNFVRAGAAGAGLRRVVLYEGVKYYGVHLGPFKTPAVEDDPRHLPPNFYYSMEDWLRAEAAGKAWDAVVLRPDVVCGPVVGNGFNVVMLIAVYAAISKELGVPLRFPGSPAAYRALVQVTDSGHLARAAEWAAVGAPGGEAYNVTNGDLFRWEQMWPVVARFFDMPLAAPQPIPLTTFMNDKGPVWERLVKRHGLVPNPYETIAIWAAGDFVLNCGYDVVSSTTKIRKAGFGEVVDSTEMFLRMLTEVRQRRVIP
jgi:nucleoside-diphosphate-sugar epimerase